MFKQLRRLYWLASEFLRRHLRLITRTILIVLVTSLAIVLTLRVLPLPRPTLRLGLVGKYTSETLPASLQSKLSVGLVTMDDGGVAHPGLATSWDIRDDGRTYVFSLDQTLHWSDGTSLTPADITYNFQDVQVERGEGTITYRLKEPFTPFLYAVSKPLLKSGRYGVGEYSLDKTIVFSGVVQSAILHSATSKLIYKFYPTESAALTAFLLGEVDKLENLSRIPPEFSQEPRFEITPNHDIPRLTVLFFNNNDSLLRSKQARQALAYAIRDKSFGHTRSLSPISASSWAYNPLVKDYAYDPERARTLLAQDVKDSSSLTLELKTTLQYLDIAESIAADWQANLGIKVNVRVVTSLTSDYQAVLADYGPPVDPDQYITWHSTQSTNYTHYTDLRVDKLLEDGRRTSDPKLRREIYQDFQRFLLEDAPAVFLFESSSFDLARKRIHLFGGV